MAEIEHTADGRPVEVRPVETRVGHVQRSYTGAWLIALVAVILLVVGAFAFGLVKIDQTQGARLPHVSLQTSGGQAPKFDVDTAKIDIGTRTEDVSVPKVTVDKETKTIEVPTVSVQRTDDPNKKN
jgi:hypothetical protein